MNILKNNGRIASKKIHLLADTIMETSITTAWSMSEDMKKQFLLCDETNEFSLEDLNGMCPVELNHRTAFSFAVNTWFSGYYGDFEVRFDSVIDYFFGWGL
jgi:hypothetical protein